METNSNSNVHIIDRKGYYFEFHRDYFVYRRKTLFKEQYVDVPFLDIENIDYYVKSVNYDRTYIYVLKLHSNSSIEITAKTQAQLSVLMEAVAIINELRSRAIISSIGHGENT